MSVRDEAMSRREAALAEALRGRGGSGIGIGGAKAKFDAKLHPKDRKGEFRETFTLKPGTIVHHAGQFKTVTGQTATHVHLHTGESVPHSEVKLPHVPGGLNPPKVKGYKGTKNPKPELDGPKPVAPKVAVPGEGGEKIPGATAIVGGKPGRWVKLDGKMVHIKHHEDVSHKVGDHTFTSPAGTTAVYKNDAPYSAPKGVAQPGNAEKFPTGNQAKKPKSELSGLSQNYVGLKAGDLSVGDHLTGPLGGKHVVTSKGSTHVIAKHVETGDEIPVAADFKPGHVSKAAHAAAQKKADDAQFEKQTAPAKAAHAAMSAKIAAKGEAAKAAHQANVDAYAKKAGDAPKAGKGVGDWVSPRELQSGDKFLSSGKHYFTVGGEVYADDGGGGKSANHTSSLADFQAKMGTGSVKLTAQGETHFSSETALKKHLANAGVTPGIADEIASGTTAAGVAAVTGKGPSTGMPARSPKDIAAAAARKAAKKPLSSAVAKSNAENAPPGGFSEKDAVPKASSALKPELNSPARSSAGRLRNFKQMSNEKLMKTWVDTKNHGKDPDAIAAITAEADARGKAGNPLPGQVSAGAGSSKGAQTAGEKATADALLADPVAADGSKFKPLKGTGGAVQVLTGKDGTAHGAAVHQFGEHIATHGNQTLGKFESHAAAKAAVVAAHDAVPKTDADLTPSKPKPDVVTSDVNEAAQALAEGKTVELNQPVELSTLIDKLGAVVKDMEAKGEKAPNYDLCKVTVKGTSIFCAEHKNIDRLNMPQLKGFPIKGSKGDAIPRDARGEADIAPEFRKALEAQGVKVTDDEELVSHLKASQRELNGGKVAGIMKHLNGGGKIEGPPIFVSREGYVIDGHHRWAAEVGVDFADGKADATMKVTRIDMPILEVLDAANAFAKEWGMPGQAAADGPKGDSPIPNYDDVTLSGGKAAGGSTGAQIVDGSDGKKYLLKRYSGNPDRVATELAANAIYRTMGARVADAGVKDVEGKPALTYPLLDGKPKQITEPSAELGKHFMTDALLANWDFIGLTDDNVLWDKDGKPFRVDQGGTLQYRAQGGKKTFGPIPGEVETMLSAAGGQGNGKVQVSETQKKEQAAQIAKTLTPEKIDEILDAAPFGDDAMRGEVKDALKGRVAWMAKYATSDKTAAQELASAASAQGKPSTPAGVAKAAEILGAKPKDVADFKASAAGKANPDDLTKSLKSELAAQQAGEPAPKPKLSPGNYGTGGSEVLKPELNSPARSPAGRLRNFQAMGNEKLTKTLLDTTAHGNDPEALSALQAEAMMRLGLHPSQPGGQAAASTHAANAAAEVHPPAPPKVQPASAGGATLDPAMIGSPGRSGAGRLRNYKAMNDGKLMGVLAEQEHHNANYEPKDPHALAMIRAEAKGRGLVEATIDEEQLEEALGWSLEQPPAVEPARNIQEGVMTGRDEAMQRRVERRRVIIEAADSLAKASSPKPFSSSKTSNWVAKGGGLPAYIQHVAHALMDKRGMPESKAIGMAIGIVKRWARGGGDVDAGTRAAAQKALGEWTALKAKSHAS